MNEVFGGGSGFKFGFGTGRPQRGSDAAPGNIHTSVQAQEMVIDMDKVRLRISCRFESHGVVWDFRSSSGVLSR